MSCVLLVDIGNIYNCIDRRFNKRSLDYNKLLQQVTEFSPIHRAIAYGTQNKDEAFNFITCIKAFGYEVKYKNNTLDQENKVIRKASWSAGMSVDIIRYGLRFDTIVVASINVELIPAYQFLKELGVKIICIGCNIPVSIRKSVDISIEITEEFLKEQNETSSNSE